MSTVRTISDQFSKFVQGLWSNETRRRLIIQKWFLRKPNNKCGIHNIFMEFITNIIKDPIHFKLDLEKVWFFEEENLALPLSWFSRQEREFLATLVGQAYNLFGEVVDLPSGDFILQKSEVFNGTCIRHINRLLILRDFALILIDKADPHSERPRPELFLRLMISVRALIANAYRNDDFKPNRQWTARLLILGKVLKANDIKTSLEEIEVFF